MSTLGTAAGISLFIAVTWEKSPRLRPVLLPGCRLSNGPAEPVKAPALQVAFGKCFAPGTLTEPAVPTGPQQRKQALVWEGRTAPLEGAGHVRHHHRADHPA